MNKVLLGEIVGVFGIKGWVKIKTFTQYPEDLTEYGALETESGTKIDIRITQIKGPNTVLAQVKGCHDRTQAEQLIKTQLFTNRENMPTAETDEYYHIDLIGLGVLDEAGKNYGHIVAVHDFGAGTFFDVQEDGNPHLKTLPFQKDSVLQVDLANKYILINPEFLLI